MNGMLMNDEMLMNDGFLLTICLILSVVLWDVVVALEAARAGIALARSVENLQAD